MYDNIERELKLLIDENLLNTEDYLNRVNAIVSIDNAKGWEHLFKNLVTPEFLKSEKFYKDIEKKSNKNEYKFKISTYYL